METSLSEPELWREMKDLQQLLGWSSFSVTRTGKMHESINTQQRWYRHEIEPVYGVEPVDGAVLSWRDTTCLWICITKPQNEHTLTHTQDLLPDETIPGTSETLCSASSSWAEQTSPRRRARNRTFILCLSWTFFYRGWGCPSGWRAWGLCHSL